MFWDFQREKYTFFQKCSKNGLVAKKNGYHFLGGGGFKTQSDKYHFFFEPFPKKKFIIYLKTYRNNINVFFITFGPWGPGAPVVPLWPLAPLCPGGPIGPFSPLTPGLPGKPPAPFLPSFPGGQ